MTEITTDAVETEAAGSEAGNAAETQPEASTDGSADSDEDTTDKGCASAVGTVSAMALISLISLGAACLRKKD